MSRATKKEIGLAHFKTMGLGFDFWFLPRVICVCVHACSISMYMYRMSLRGRAVQEEHLKVESRGKIAFSLRLISQLCHWDGTGRISIRKVPSHINILKYISLGTV